jgi:hypothetical protein
MGHQRPKLSSAERRQAKERIRKLLPRCLATTGTHVCEREIGHGNGWNGDKHRSNGFSWTDAYAKQQIEKRPA